MGGDDDGIDTILRLRPVGRPALDMDLQIVLARHGAAGGVADGPGFQFRGDMEGEDGLGFRCQGALFDPQRCVTFFAFGRGMHGPATGHQFGPQGLRCPTKLGVGILGREGETRK